MLDSSSCVVVLPTCAPTSISMFSAYATENTLRMYTLPASCYIYAFTSSYVVCLSSP
jgi:hypothetical protein